MRHLSVVFLVLIVTAIGCEKDTCCPATAQPSVDEPVPAAETPVAVKETPTPVEEKPAKVTEEENKEPEPVRKISQQEIPAIIHRMAESGYPISVVIRPKLLLNWEPVKHVLEEGLFGTDKMAALKDFPVDKLETVVVLIRPGYRETEKGEFTISSDESLLPYGTKYACFFSFSQPIQKDLEIAVKRVPNTETIVQDGRKYYQAISLPHKMARPIEKATCFLNESTVLVSSPATPMNDLLSLLSEPRNSKETFEFGRASDAVWCHIGENSERDFVATLFLMVALQEKKIPEAKLRTLHKAIYEREQVDLRISPSGDNLFELSAKFKNEEIAKESLAVTRKLLVPLLLKAHGGIALLRTQAMSSGDTASELDARKRIHHLQKILGNITIDGESKNIALSVKNEPFSGELLTYFVNSYHQTTQRLIRFNAMRQIGFGMETYWAMFAHYSRAAIYDKGGKPLLSWRVAMLPYIEQNDLYKEFHLDEPWDSPHNKKLISRIPPEFLAPGTSPKEGQTRVMVFSGKGTPFDGDNELKEGDIKDGAAKTIMLIEAGPDKAATWTKPVDIPFDPKDPKKSLGQSDEGGYIVAFFDSGIRFLPDTTDAKTLKALITPAGGEEVSLDDL